jgi:hypothetical protein
VRKVDRPTRLPRSFHMTFKPERQYLNALLRFASGGGSGDAKAISAATGIPTGESTGKVPATIDYSIAMGLVELEPTNQQGAKKPILTDFGRVVLVEDPFLKTALTQWIAHFNMCSPLRGAETWYQVFFKGANTLGDKFERAKLEDYLRLVYRNEKSAKVGPIVGMYEDEACFRACGVLSESGSLIQRRSAPTSEEYAFAYGVWLLKMMEEHFPNQNQISITDLENHGGWRSISGWDSGTQLRMLGFIERKGLLEIDRQMEPWLLRAKCAAPSAWKSIYNDLI